MNNSSLSADDILVRAQETPNPMALKFVVNAPLREEGKVTFHSQEDCVSLPLVYSLFEILGVTQVYLFRNTVTITHTGELPNDLIKENVISVIKTRLPVHNPNFEFSNVELEKKPVDRSSLPKEIQEIEEILDRTIRPGLQADGGDLEVVGLKNNELQIVFQGACGGCPSALMGTLDAIQSILRTELKNEELFVYPI